MPTLTLDLVVYEQTVGALAAAPTGLPPGVEVARLGPEVLATLYRDDAHLRRTFSRFLALGFVGVTLHQEGRWLAHLWTATPETGPPLHLPKALGGRTWLFGGHTRPEARNRGLLKAALRGLGRQLAAAGAHPTERVFADAFATNMPSRRAMLAIGFLPCGRLRTLRVPRTPLVWGRWTPDGPHPAWRIA